ncbi:organic solute transporter alpha-like protein [Schistocerca americana]|uniref:organic solute transporter alpha-like protein n=1 Tax=Schistocerca americana TaxID=7009 RepID=UPI001F502B76|nr:organic solute transporter alpha-like protein [Schistocerca americana]
MIREYQPVFQFFWTASERLLEELSGNATNCTLSKLPSASDFYAVQQPKECFVAALGPLLVSAIVISTVAFISTMGVYTLSLRHVLTGPASKLTGPTVYVISIYPVASVVAFMSVMLPRSFYLMAALEQDLFAISVYQMFCLLVVYCERQGVGPGGLAAPTHADTGCGAFWRLPFRRSCCHPMSFTRRSLLKLRLAVLQMPVVLWIMYGVCYALWSEDEALLDAAYPYLVAVQLVSLVLATWGTLSVARGLSSALGVPHATHKFLALQLTVLLPQLQCLVAGYAASFFLCSVPFTPVFWANLVVNVLTLLEVLALSLWAFHLYCRQEPGFRRLPDDTEAVRPASWLA